VHIHLDLADALQIHPLGLGQPAGAIAVFRPLHRVKARFALEPGIAGFLAGLDSPEETLKCLVEPAQCGLLTGERPHRLIRAYRPDLAQLRRLIPVEDAGFTARPRIPALLQRRVVELAVGLHTRRQRRMLPRRGPQPKHIRASHQATASHWCSM
jgi:hypothetical protein